jgi:hypothetical protein
MESTEKLRVVSTTALALSVESTIATAVGAVIQLYHRSATPEDNDVVGRVIAYGLDDNATPQKTEFGRLDFIAADVSDTTEDGQVSIWATIAGTATEHLRLVGGQVLFPSGLVTRPGISFLSDTGLNAGLYLAANDTLGVALNGANAAYWDVSTAGRRFNVVDAGTEALPSITLYSLAKGFYSVSDHSIGVAPVACCDDRRQQGNGRSGLSRTAMVRPPSSPPLRPSAVGRRSRDPSGPDRSRSHRGRLKAMARTPPSLVATDFPFGARDGVDSTAGIQALLNRHLSQRGGVCDLPPGGFTINMPGLIIPPGTEYGALHLRGAGRNPTALYAGNLDSETPVIRYADVPGTVTNHVGEPLHRHTV